MKKCNSYHTQTKRRYEYNPITGEPTGHDVEVGVCWGTKEMDQCSCNGDRTKCDFYPEIREKAYKEDNMLIDTIETDNKIISFLLDQHAQTKNANFLIAASVIDHLIRENRHLATEHKWISVEDGLPKVAVDVLITDGKYVSMGYVLNMGDSGLCPWVAKQPVFYRDITHWMPLPTSPTEKEN